MSNGKRKPPQTDHGHWQQPERAHGAARRPPVNTPHSGASPFDAPTMYQPHTNPRHTPQPGAAFDAPTMLHQGQPHQEQRYHTGQHAAADELPLPEGPEHSSPFDAPTMFQPAPITGVHPSFPQAQDGSPFDAPTMLHQESAQGHHAASYGAGNATYPPPSGQSWREAQPAAHDAHAYHMQQEQFGEFHEFGVEAQPEAPAQAHHARSYYGNPTPTHDELELPQEDDLFTGDIPDIPDPYTGHQQGYADYPQGEQGHHQQPSYNSHRDPHATPPRHDYAQDDDATSYIPQSGTGQPYSADFDSNPSYNRQALRHQSAEWSDHNQQAQHHYAHNNGQQSYWSGHQDQRSYQEPYGPPSSQPPGEQSPSSHYYEGYGEGYGEAYGHDPGVGQEAILEQEDSVAQAAHYQQQAEPSYQHHDPHRYEQGHGYHHQYGQEQATPGHMPPTPPPFQGHEQAQGYYQEQGYQQDQGYYQAQDYGHGHEPQAPHYGQEQGYYQEQGYQQDQGYQQEQGYGQEQHYGQPQGYDDQGYGQSVQQTPEGSYGQGDEALYADYGQHASGQEPHHVDYGAQGQQPQDAGIVVGHEVGAYEDIDVQAALQAASYRVSPSQNDQLYAHSYEQQPSPQAQYQEPHQEPQAPGWEQHQQYQGGHQDAYSQQQHQHQQHQGDWAHADVRAPDAYNPYANAAPQPSYQEPYVEQSNWEANHSPAQDVAYDPTPHQAQSRDAFGVSKAQPSEGPGDLIARLRDALGGEDIAAREDDLPAWRSVGVFQEGAVMLDPGEAMLLEQRIEEETNNVLHSAPSNGVALAELFWQQLHQALKKLSLYQQQQHRNIASYFVPAMGVIRAYHKHHGDLIFTVRPFDFMLGESSIFTSDSHENSPTYKLYGAGVRALTVADGVPLAELVAFGQCLALTPQELQDEDIASRLWRADLRKITTLQVQSIEIAQEGEEDIEDLAQLVAMLTAQLHTDDPNNAVNFRGIDALDLVAGGALMNAETERVFGALPALARREETALWHRIRAVEEASLATYGSQLYSCLFKHVDSAYQKMYGHRPEHPPLDVVELFAPQLLPLCDHLFLEHDFYHMAILLDAMEWQTTQRHSLEADQWRHLLGQLSNRMSSPENVALLLAHLREAPQLDRAQEDALGVYLHFLGADVQRALIEALPELSPKVRRLLLEVMSTAPRARGLLQAALGQLEEHEQVLLELLQVAGEHSSAMPRGSLRLLLRHKNQRIQSKAFLLLAQEHPDEAREVADTLLLQASPEARASIVDILCNKDEDGVYLLLSFAHSEGFARLPAAEQQALYARLGRTNEPAVVDDCIEALSHKSQLLKPQIDRRKRLAVTALKASQTDDARKHLEQALQTDLHSKKMRAEIADALKTMWT